MNESAARQLIERMLDSAIAGEDFAARELVMEYRGDLFKLVNEVAQEAIARARRDFSPARRAKGALN